MSLRNFEQIRHYFANNKVPYYFISPTNFNLINMHQWVKQWLNVNYLDCYDQSAPEVFTPPQGVQQSFESTEEVNLYLLNQSATRQRLESSGRALFLFFNPELEALCQALKLTLILPPHALVSEVDNKITTTEIGNQAGVESVPNVLAKVDSYARLCELALRHQLGDKLVVQTAYGDSGKTTFFIENETDYLAHAAQIECEDKVKIMKWIRCRGTAIEACATKNGTYVGPLLTELIGLKELTPYQGGWCGNELYQDAFPLSVRQHIQQKTEQIGNALYARGYRGYFEMDYLLDLADGQLYLGELDPRIIPLFLFHLLEYANAEFTLPTSEYNQLSLQQGAQGSTSQLICKYTQAEIAKVHQAPVSGVYRLVDGQLVLLKQTSDATAKGDAPDQGYLLRIMNTGDYAYKGGDLAILLLNAPMTEQEGTSLNASAQQWLKALHQAFDIQVLTTEEQALIDRYTRPSSVKASREASRLHGSAD